VIDVQDRGLADGVQSYQRVVHLWDGGAVTTSRGSKR